MPSLAVADRWSWDDDTSELEIRNFYKTMPTLLRLPPVLVDANLVPAYGAVWTHSTRTWGHLVLHDKYELQAGWQLGALIISDPALAAGPGIFGSQLLLSSASSAQRRLVDF